MSRVPTTPSMAAAIDAMIDTCCALESVVASAGSNRTLNEADAPSDAVELADAAPLSPIVADAAAFVFALADAAPVSAIVADTGMTDDALDDTPPVSAIVADTGQTVAPSDVNIAPAVAIVTDAGMIAVAALDAPPTSARETARLNVVFADPATPLVSAIEDAAAMTATP